jgi:predicted CXXCH cytochrome family protein
MKRSIVLILTVCIGVLFIASMGFAATPPYKDSGAASGYQTLPVDGAGLGINGTVHDLSQTGANGGKYASSTDDYLQRICVFCHAPHHAYRLSNANGGAAGTAGQAGDQFTYLPLWNHGLTQATTFQPYSNGYGPSAPSWKAAQSMAVNGTAFKGIGAVSMLCLSCHDGTMAVNSYGQIPQDPRSRGSATTSINVTDYEYAIGYGNGTDTDNLQNHHPIGFEYDTVQQADGEIAASSTVFMGTTVKISDVLYNRPGGGAATMECTTCHAVHNTGNAGEKLLYSSDMHSDMCLNCHLKGDQQ